MKIGIVGMGFVGSAVAKNFRCAHEVSSHDIKFEGSKIEAVKNTEVCFVCVPAPTKKDWTLDLSIIRNVLYELHMIKYAGDVVIKSTVLPGSCDSLQEEFPNFNIVHNPEFLRESTSCNDFRNQPAVLLSGKSLDKVKQVYGEWEPGISFMQSENFNDTELAKYIHNCFLAMKVTFFTELTFYQERCSAFKNGQSISLPRKMAASQGGIGYTHLMTPGNDGKIGFGGTCFPKDLKAFNQHAVASKAPQLLLQVAHQINSQFRPETK